MLENQANQATALNEDYINTNQADSPDAQINAHTKKTKNSHLLLLSFEHTMAD